MKSLKEQLAELEDPAPPRELDPESHDVFAGSVSSVSDAEEETQEFDSREHYESVGKSKLRKPAQPTLGKQYAGAKVSRTALNGDDDETTGSGSADEDDDLEDPFEKSSEVDEDSGEEEDVSSDAEQLEFDGAVDEDEEIDSDEAFTSEDEQRFKEYTFRGSKLTRLEKPKNKAEAMNGANGSGSESEDLEDDMQDLDVEDSDDEADDVSDEEGDLDMDDEDDEDSVEDELEDENETDATSDSDVPRKPAASSDRAALRELMSSDMKAVTSTISAAASADAQKGRAVKEQYQTFDKLIDLRIKLQKGITASNSLPSEHIEDEAMLGSVRKAEEAALQLWSTLESLRHDFLDAQENATPASTPRKRKRPSPATPETSLASLWSRTETIEKRSLPHRRAILDKWSAKVRASTVTTDPRSRLTNNTPSNQGITSVIDAYLTTHTLPTTPTTYTDDPFYQSLLRDLIASRSASTTTNPTLSATVLPSSLLPRSKNHRPNVDTKASKGRKLRYTVHEKLLNFAAPETVLRGGTETGTRLWGDEQTDEFFGSLFGGRRVLDEEDEEGGDDGMGNGGGLDGGVVGNGDDAEVLRLFRR